jgi:multidrug efflux pump subunit AcrA (membrane-fusion protein)
LQRRNVFAPVDAVVREVPVQHDAAVASGTVLAVLESEQLALQQQQVQGERDQTQQRLLAIVAEKLKGTRDERDPNLLSRLTSQETELRQMLAAQDQQLDILRQQIESLVVRSPLDGRVLSWSTEELLVRRPVRRGQILMTVANVDGPWILELQVPDWEIAHVQAGRVEASSGQRVTFMLGTQPGVEYRGSLRQVATTVTDRSDATDQMPSVLVTADIDGQAISNLRPGASVSARIDCGRRSIGYVWLRQLWEAIEARVLF